MRSGGLEITFVMSHRAVPPSFVFVGVANQFRPSQKTCPLWVMAAFADRPFLAQMLRTYDATSRSGTGAASLQQAMSISNVLRSAIIVKKEEDMIHPSSHSHKDSSNIVANLLLTLILAICLSIMKLSTYTGSLFAALAHYHLAAGASNETDGPPTFQLGDDPAFNFEYLSALQNAFSGGSDISPVLGVAKNVKAGDFDSFHEEFYKLANATKAQAEDPENAYDPINVRDTWFSASQYYRRADVYIHRNWSDPRVESIWSEQTAAFNKAIAALPIPGKRVNITSPEGNFTVEAVWYAASEKSDEKLPTLIVGNGFDAAQEDSYHYYCAAALARGWNCITYEGPGQNTVRRTQNLGFIPNWELVTTPVVDYVLSEKKEVVDEDRLVLVGHSFGGYLAARAAAFEPRLSAVVLLGGIWDLYEGYSSQLSEELLSIYEAGNKTEFDDKVLTLRDAGELPTEATWGLDYGLWVFKTHSPSDFFNQTKQYRIENVTDLIRMPVFVGDAEFETVFPGQAKKVADALGDKGTFHMFKGVAGYHCQTGAQQEMMRTMFAWLAKTC